MRDESCFKVIFPICLLICSDLGGMLARSWWLQGLQLTEEDRDVRSLLGIHSHHRGQ